MNARRMDTERSGMQNINLYDDGPQTVSLRQLCENEEVFYIPSYQRGYKWGKYEIEALLNDILDYSESKDGEFYCLQPLVVRRDSDERHWRVVDGQQRLTTIYILLQFIHDQKKTFHLKYQREAKLTCPDISDIEIDSSSSETYHITSAYRIISDWLKADENKDDGNKRLEVIARVTLNSTGFIWYRLDNGDSSPESLLAMEHEYFMNLNSGKIRLTESELIKALLLHKKPTAAPLDESAELRQIFQAEEWNRMEHSLRQPEIWYFIAGRKKIPQNAMDYLLELIWLAQPENERAKFQNSEYPIFTWAERQDAEELWKNLVSAFRLVMGWNEDNELRNLIGYFASRRRADSQKISSILSEMLRLGTGKSEDMYQTKSGLKKRLWKDAMTEKSLIFKQDEFPVQTVNINYDRYHGYRYDKNYDEVFNVLLLANISLYSLDGTAERFDFVKFNDLKYPWNVEHISPANPKSNEELKNRLKAFIDEQNEELEEHAPKGMKDVADITPQVPSEVSELYDLLSRIPEDENPGLENLEGLKEDDRQRLETFKARLLPTEDDDTMPIRNLSLLTERCNKGIGNRFFFDKKQRLRAYQNEGQFIPRLTLNVFSKWYSKTDTFPLFWSENDGADYIDAIDNCFTKIVRKILD